MSIVLTSVSSAIVGVIGPNGAGKSTLIKMILGREKADSGSFIVGNTVKIAVVDQDRDSLDSSRTVYDEITTGSDFLTLGNALKPSGASPLRSVRRKSRGERSFILLLVWI